MSEKQPGRAHRVRIDREDGAPSEIWERVKDEDDYWSDEKSPSPRGSMPSHELLRRVRDAIGVEHVS
jgi:hypothetical protein